MASLVIGFREIFEVAVVVAALLAVAAAGCGDAAGACARSNHPREHCAMIASMRRSCAAGS